MGQHSPATCAMLVLAAVLLGTRRLVIPVAAARTPTLFSSRQQDPEHHILHPQQQRTLLQQQTPSEPGLAGLSPSQSITNYPTTDLAPTASPALPSTNTNFKTAANTSPTQLNSSTSPTDGPQPLKLKPAGPVDGPQGPDGSVNGVAWDPTDSDSKHSGFSAAESPLTDGPAKGCQFMRGVAFGAPDAKDQQGNTIAPGFQWDPSANPLMQNMTALLQTVTMGSGWQLQAADNAAQCCNLCLAHTDTDPLKPGVQVVGKPCDVFSWVPAAAWGADAAVAIGSTAGGRVAGAANSTTPAAADVAGGACLLITLGPTSAAVAMVWGTDSSAQSGVPYL